MTAATASGSAERWGPLWGSRPLDWARCEYQQRPTYDEVLRRLGDVRGRRVLDIGCGAGAFLLAAAERGARVHGFDASPALLDVARRRVPAAELRSGDMQSLPYEDNTFDVVTGFNSFFFAADIVAALREARRVARPGAAVVIQVWGDPAHCELEAMKAAARPFLPPAPDGAPAGPALWKPGVLEDLAGQAELTPEAAFDLRWAYEFNDAVDLASALVAPAGMAELAGAEHEPALRDAIVAALAPQRTPVGGYRVENEWHVLMARA